MRFAISSNPFLGQMVRQNPELEYILNNPEMLRTIMTPENIRMAMGMMQSMRGMPGAAPNPLFGMGGMPAGPSAGPGTSTEAPATGTTGPAPATGAPPAFPGFDPAMLAQMMGGFGAPAAPGASAASSTGAPTGAAPSTGTTVPPTSAGAWQQPPPVPFANLAQMMRMFSPPGATGTGAAPAPTTPPVDPKVKYATQLEKMKEMGFSNEAANLEALQATNGNIEAAIERMLSMFK